ncbi:MAG TPA: trypsin-like peptidase domain-containing protein [Anaerolineae bacterium]|nr:trypsin-like peptidase domain-containing protein [Anaerolineae bacterium]
MDTADRFASPNRAVTEKVMRSVVQIVALQRAFLGNLSPVWTGSGTLVHSSGLILTNCHVANPRAMGMSAPAADMLGIAITGRSDEAPALTYLAQVAAQSPEIDLAVLKIVSGLDGKKVSALNLPAIDLGDSDALELGDQVCIFGYPGIGGETVTYTTGAVSGFSKESGVSAKRAWIKTDATIAGGNSGGTAVDLDGLLIGVPTQAAAGSGITPVDARPVVDTNKDGRVDEHDSPIAIGGFINGLRPINLAKPLLAKAGVAAKPAANTVKPSGSTVKPAGSTVKPPSGVVKPPSGVVKPPSGVVKPPSGTVKPPSGVVKPSGGAGAPQPVAPPSPGLAPKATGPAFTNLVFSTQVSADGRPVNAAAILASGSKSLYATFEFSGMKNGLAWTQVWAVDGKTIVSEQGAWDAGAKGRRALQLSNPSGLPNGKYHLALAVKGQVTAEGEVVVGRRSDDTDTQVSGQVVDQSNGRGIAGALVIALRPGVKVQAFVQQQSSDMAFTSARTDSSGRFTFPQQLPKGQAYGLVVVARGYRDLAIEGALRIGASAPEQAQLSAIALSPE